MTPQPHEFDVTTDLPRAEVVVLEASAGTGKTWTIAALATRYLAEGIITLPELLVITFNNSAAHDLRTRIRERLVTAIKALSQAGPPEPEDPQSAAPHPVDELLVDAAPEVIAQRLSRLRAALGDFDAATISTIHDFCNRMIAGLGVLGDPAPRTEFAADLDDLAHDVAADLYVRQYANRAKPDFGMSLAKNIAAQAVRSPAGLRPDTTPAPAEVRFATAVRKDVAERQRVLGRYTHDDKIRRLRDALQHPEHASAAVERMRGRYRVVLVDEFQDTDPEQWQILSAAFGPRPTDDAGPQPTMVLIGDPKQSIYAFRGGDIDTYLAAARNADRQLTLTTNHRSDKPLVEALSHVLSGARLGHPQVEVLPVTAGPTDIRLRVRAPELAAPIRVRSVPVGSISSATAIRDTIRKDVVGDISRLLEASTYNPTPHKPKSERPLWAGDIAILVNSNIQADEMRDALTDEGIPAVHAGATNVYSGTAGEEWMTLLKACQQPRDRTIRQVALTSFVGMTFAELVSATPEQASHLAAMVREWSQLAADSIADLMAVLRRDGLVERLVATRGGDRLVTDLRHIGQDLHEVQRRDHLGVSGLIKWLGRQQERSSEGSRRLETDAAAVQLFTVHRAKGLQFPVVYAPELWSRTGKPLDSNDPVEYRDADGRSLHVTGRWSKERRTAIAAYHRNRDEENLRKAYVALTRAQCQLVVYSAAPMKGDTPKESIAPWPRLLQRDDGTGPGTSGEVAATVRPVDPERIPLLHHPGISLQAVTAMPPDPGSGSDRELPDLTARQWQRTIDRGWRRSSYSSLTRAVHGAGPTRTLSEPEVLHADALLDDPLTGDEDAADGARTAEPAAGKVSPLAELPRGAAFGTLVHAVLEDFDPAAPDLGAELLQHCEHWSVRLPNLGVGPQALAEALLPVVNTPLGDIGDDLRLRDIPARDRLPELDFEMPMAGGNQASADRPGIRLGDVADLLDHHLPADDPLVGYPEHLRDPDLRSEELRGFLTGSIDAVLRVGDPQRFLVVDYKTNWLLPATDPGPLQLRHHSPSAMATAMIASHYPLQALLYSVALHRFLRWRLHDYSPAEHLGGVAYLFVRGMGGPDTPIVDGSRCGVFDWRPPAALISELSDRIDLSEPNHPEVRA